MSANTANSVLRLCDEIQPLLPELAKGNNNNSGRSKQWKNVQNSVNSRCTRAKILRRIKNNAKASNELMAYETYLRNAVLPGIQEYNQPYNQPYNVQPNNNSQLNNTMQNNTRNNGLTLGGRRRKSRKSKKSRKTRKARKTRRSRK
jgi:hypothetical protein